MHENDQLCEPNRVPYNEALILFVMGEVIFIMGARFVTHLLPAVLVVLYYAAPLIFSALIVIAGVVIVRPQERRWSAASQEERDAAKKLVGH